MSFTVEKGGLPLIPEEEYSAIFVGYELLEGLKYGDAVKLKFQIDEGQYKDTVLDLLANARLASKTKFGQIVSILLGKPLKEGAEIDVDGLQGAPCTIVVITVTDNYGGEFSTIERVKPKTQL